MSKYWTFGLKMSAVLSVPIPVLTANLHILLVCFAAQGRCCSQDVTVNGRPLGDRTNGCRLSVKLGEPITGSWGRVLGSGAVRQEQASPGLGGTLLPSRLVQPRERPFPRTLSYCPQRTQLFPNREMGRGHKQIVQSYENPGG